MEKLRYRRVFKQGIAAILLCILLSGSMIGFFVASKIQYNRLVADMKPTEATIVDIDIDIHLKGPDEQKIYIEYVVDGIVYSRKLKTDTTISFAAGTGAHYSVGDRLPIFYDPENPEIIASPRTQSVGVFWLIFALFLLVLVLIALWWMIKSRRKFLVTQEEYDKEGEEIKKSKLAKKQQKKQAKAERKKKHPKARKIGKIVLIILAALVGAFVLYLLFGLILISLGR